MIVCVTLLMIGLSLERKRSGRSAPRLQSHRSDPPRRFPFTFSNDPPQLLPDGFVPGTQWKFTTWTIPSTLTFTATVDKVAGGWAYLTVQTEDD